MSFFSKTLEFINDSGQTAGEAFLKESAHVYYDFTQLTGANAASISNGNAGLVDQSGNGHTATIVGSPVVRDVTINAETIKTLHDESTNAINTNINGSTFMQNGFAIFMTIQLQDGQPASTQNLFGGIKPTNIGVNIFLAADGKLGFAVGTTSGFFVWTTANAVFTNGVNDTCNLMFRVNFNTEVVIWKNGVNLNGSFTTGAISTPTPSQIPTDFTTNFYVGALNNNGTTTSVGGITSIFNFAITPIFFTVAPAFQLHAIIEELTKWSWQNWQAKEIHVTSANASTYRSNLISTLFNGGALPTMSPTVTTGVTGAIHICNTSNISNFSSWDRLTFTTTDIDGATWSHKVFHGHTSQTPNGKLLIVNNGHQSDVAAAYEDLMERSGSYGYDVAYTAMPVVGDNTETSAKVTSTSSTGHNQMLSNGLDQVGYNPLELFLFDKIAAINYLNGSYSQIIMTGNSGGGWTTVLCAAVDERIDISIPNRGVGVRSMKVKETNIDFEQGGMPSFTWTPAILGSTVSGTRQYTNYTNITYYDMLALGTTSGRIVQRQSHNNDDCCFHGTMSWIWMDTLKTLAASLGGEYHNIIDFKPGTATHQFSYSDINNIFHLLGDT